MTPPEIAHLRAALAAPGSGSSDFDLNPDAAPPRGRVLKSAGVLVALQPGRAGLDVILTKRATTLKHHPGQIAFPGGRQDPGDTGPTDAALREAEEEIGLPRTRPEILGLLPTHETVTTYLVTPVVALIDGAFDETPEPGEVSEIFRVPLVHIADSANYRIEGRLWRGTRRAYYVVPYGPYYIWGATASILHTLADRLTP